MNEYQYNIESINLGESSRYEPQFSTIELCSFGNNLADLLINAEYQWIDQDGGELACGPADDNQAEEFIRKWFKEYGCDEDKQQDAADRHEARQWAGEK